MKRICWVLVVLLGASGCIMAQELPQAELFGGYSFVRGHTNANTTLNLNGWNVSATGNINRCLGITVDVAQQFGTFSSGMDYQFRSFLVGPQFTYREKEKVTPFVHALIGDARFSQSQDTPQFAYHENSLGLVVGGGVDVHFHSIIALRLIQADYYMTKFSKDRQGNFRLGFGVVLKLGKK
jgi:hypothetical protein